MSDLTRILEIAKKDSATSETWIRAVLDSSTLHPTSLEFHKTISDAAWIDREHGRAIDYEKIVDDELGTPASDKLEIIKYEATAQRLRYDFKFSQLDDVNTRESLREGSRSELLLPFRAFASLGLRMASSKDITAEAMDLNCVNAVGRWIVLHGLWFGTHLEEQSDLMIELSDRMIKKHEIDANLYYWRAFALRNAGDLSDALESIDQALELHDSAQVNVHQDYVRERELINTMKMINTTIESKVDSALRSSSELLRREASESRRTIQSSLIGVIEIFGVFIAIVTLVGGSALTLFNSKSIDQQLWTIGILTVGCIAFFVILRLIVGLPFVPTRRRRQDTGSDRSGSL
ncbi:tetratricopeptide repeat protein [Brevibacterium litoralis]|uniref:tetratricopeptide repeat protein n=1 Tax=Brevibacterium litoralis TaxID=3138935 RepID=UPI0032EAD9B3